MARDSCGGRVCPYLIWALVKEAARSWPRKRSLRIWPRVNFPPSLLRGPEEEASSGTTAAATQSARPTSTRALRDVTLIVRWPAWTILLGRMVKDFSDSSLFGNKRRRGQVKSTLTSRAPLTQMTAASAPGTLSAVNVGPLKGGREASHSAEWKGCARRARRGMHEKLGNIIATPRQWFL